MASCASLSRRWPGGSPGGPERSWGLGSNATNVAARRNAGNRKARQGCNSRRRFRRGGFEAARRDGGAGVPIALAGV